MVVGDFGGRQVFLFTKQNVRHCEPRQGYIQPPNQQQVLGDFQHFFQMRFYLLWCRGSFESQIAVLQHFRFGQTSDQRSADCYTSDDTFLFWGSWSFFPRSWSPFPRKILSAVVLLVAISWTVAVYKTNVGKAQPDRRSQFSTRKHFH